MTGGAPDLQAGNSLPQSVHADDHGRHASRSACPLGRGFTRLFTNYSYQRVRVTDINSIYTDPTVLRRNPFLQDSLLIGQGGERIISKVTPSIVHNTVDNPIFPTSGRRFTLSTRSRRARRQHQLLQADARGRVFLAAEPADVARHARRTSSTSTSSRVRCRCRFSRSCSSAANTSVRGFDIRSIGPSDPVTGLVLGGNKSLLFNVEQSIHDCRARCARFCSTTPARCASRRARSSRSGKTVLQQVVPPGSDPRRSQCGRIQLVDPNAPPPTFVTVGQQSAFKTSTGVEIRFFMPVLNVPFRLIFYDNPQRAGVLDNNLQPQQAVSGSALRSVRLSSRGRDFMHRSQRSRDSPGRCRPGDGRVFERHALVPDDADHAQLVHGHVYRHAVEERRVHALVHDASLGSVTATHRQPGAEQHPDRRLEPGRLERLGVQHEPRHWRVGERHRDDREYHHPQRHRRRAACACASTTSGSSTTRCCTRFRSRTPDLNLVKFRRFRSRKD